MPPLKSYDSDLPYSYAPGVFPALELMKNGKLPLHEISWQCGIGDYKYFNTVFRKYLGCGPKEYMAQIGGWLK